MKNVVLICVILASVWSSAEAQFQVSFMDPSSEGYGYSVATTFEGDGYLVAGNKMIGYSEFGKLTWIDNNGNPIWSKNYQIDSSDIRIMSICRVRESPSGLPKGYLLTGIIDHIDPGRKLDVFLMRIDQEGYPVLVKTYGTNWNDYGRRVIQVKDPKYDNAYIIAGERKEPGLGSDQDALIIKTDEFGNLIRSVIIGDDAFQTCKWIEPLRKGELVICGKTFTSCTPGPDFDSDIWVVKLKGNLNILWSKTIGGRPPEFAYDGAVCVRELEDGSLLLTGEIEDYSPPGPIDYFGTDMFLLNLTPKADFISMHKYFRRNAIHTTNMVISKNGSGKEEYIVSGFSIGKTTRMDAMLTKIQSSGDVVWSRLYGGELFDFSEEVIKDYDDGYVVVGRESSFVTTDFKAYLVVTDNAGDSNSDCQQDKVKIDISEIYPCISNDGSTLTEIGDEFESYADVYEAFPEVYTCPVVTKSGLSEKIPIAGTEPEQLKVLMDQAIVQLSNPYNNSKFCVYSISGVKLIEKDISGGREIVDLSGLNPGCYILRLISDDGSMELRKYVSKF